MKKISLAFGIVFALFQAALPGRADDLFNPSPATIDSPHDDAAVKRLTVSSDGKTPVVKNLDPAWIKTLADRGEPMLYTKANSHEFDYIGMPVGGIGAGEIYLSGDGRLWDWDIFGTRCVPGFPVEQGLAYKTPHLVRQPGDSSQQVFDQGFVIRTVQGGKTDVRTLDKNGFSDVRFSGQYPVGTVDYRDPASPVHVQLEAYSPFIPSSVEDSSYPATILTYTVENTSQDKIECTLGGWMENETGIKVRGIAPILLQNATVESKPYQAVNFSMKTLPDATRPPVTFDDFESGKYDRWTAVGDAFGTHPAKVDEFKHQVPITGAQGDYLVDSYAQGSDAATGTLTSAPFTVDQSYLSFMVGGGADHNKEYIGLLVDGKIVQYASGKNDEKLRPALFDLRDLKGKTAQIQIGDNGTGAWGHILVDDIVLTDLPYPLETQSDVGDMTLALVGEGTATAQIAGDPSSHTCLDSAPSPSAETKTSDRKKLVGAVRRAFSLNPGEKATLTYIVAWHFPNPLTLGLSTDNRRQYVTRFTSAQDVVDHLVPDLGRLSAATMAWRDTWYDSTLPYYFLDRTFLNVSTLATSTSYLLADGRFYGYEGRYSCPGTCTHVWAYQQAIGYLFPDIEKAIMEKTEFVPGLGMLPGGGIKMRGEFQSDVPVDGQSGIILRTYLAYRMSADDAFLARNYASVKKATDFLIAKYDSSRQGILEGGQANTMDSAWYGKIAWLSLYYQAALRATAEMADASNDGAYAKRLRAIADQGRTNVETQLFNGEYFYHVPDPAHPNSPGTYSGCPIEQLMGQNWAYEVGLGDIVDRAKALTALNSMWRYNYTTDTGVYRDKFKAGRWYALTGDGGLIVCIFPAAGGEDSLKKGNAQFAAYDNECWTGSEYEAAALMMWDGQVDKALAEVKTVNERYDAAKRNPWDECECGSHYSRAMSGYGVFVAACGFEYDGPKGSMAFAPRVSPEDFKTAFTSAEGWGSFSQKYSGTGMEAALDLRYGKLRLKTLSLVLPSGSTAQTAKVQVDGKDQPVTASRNGDRIALSFPTDVNLTAGQSLGVTVTQ